MISIIIPARDEEHHIKSTLVSIHEAVGGQYSYEILVVDNGSTDQTRDIAMDCGARVLLQPSGTIAALRNEGVRRSQGEVIVFLDADVVLTQAWADSLPATIQRFREDHRLLVGSICEVPDDASWLERLWFAQRTTRSVTHIGTGHLLTTRAFFDELGGFNGRLVTGEDFDLSLRARERGGIVLDPGLRVKHLGYPKTIAAFIRREAWHGTSDFTSLRSVLRSRVALAAVVFLTLHMVMAIGFLAAVPPLSSLAVVAICLLCLASSVRTYRDASLPVVVANTFLYYVYYAARALALLRRYARPARRERLLR